MKIDSVNSFYHNLSINQDHVQFVAVSGSSKDELVPLVEFILNKEHRVWVMPDDLDELSQIMLFQTHECHVFLQVEKLKKKEFDLFFSSLKNLTGTIYLISTTASGIQPIYQQLKNELLWLDLSQEKPWQKKDRYLFLLQAEAKKQGFILDKLAATYLIDNEKQQLDLAKSRLQSCMLLALGDKKISLELIKSLLPPAEADLDFQWIDQLLFKKEPIEMPSCKDASDLLLFLGQMRYVLGNALKIKSLQSKHLSPEEMKGYFSKLSPQALSMQIKKLEDVSASYIKDVLSLVYDKELELKQDFQQPLSVFIALITNICEKKLCLKPGS